jgi:hypothetical protein
MDAQPLFSERRALRSQAEHISTVADSYSLPSHEISGILDRIGA